MSNAQLHKDAIAKAIEILAALPGAGADFLAENGYPNIAQRIHDNGDVAAYYWRRIFINNKALQADPDDSFNRSFNQAVKEWNDYLDAKEKA